jgi:hypothetical protein
MSEMSETERAFERFARLEARGSSPLYETLALGVAGDDDLLALAAEVPDDQPSPNLLLAAVQCLLFERPDARLGAYYASVADSPEPPEDGAFEAFREFCRTHRDELSELLSSRRLQTNLVRRCAVLLPAFEYVSRRCDRTPLGLVDVGTSAGLNLLWDRYDYEFTDYGHYGRGDSPVRIPCGVLGMADPPFPEEMPPVGTRLGIDLNPLDVRDDEDARWLRALVWPELEERRSLTEAALSVAREHPPELVRGDAVTDLPDVCERVPADEQLCIVNSHTLYQFTLERQAEFEETVDRIGESRDLSWLWCEPAGDRPEVRLTEYDDGEPSTELLAYHDAHGRWLEWLQETDQ